jgi:hypothetical protein
MMVGLTVRAIPSLSARARRDLPGRRRARRVRGTAGGRQRPGQSPHRDPPTTAQLWEVTSGADDDEAVEPDPEAVVVAFEEVVALDEDVPVGEEPDVVVGVPELCVLVVPVPVSVVVVVLCETAATLPEPSTGSWPSRIWR